MPAVARELKRNPAAVYEVDRRLRVERSNDALAKRSVRDRILVRLLADTETYAVELASKVGVSRTAIIKAVDQLEGQKLVVTRMESELPERLKRPQQRRIALTDAGKARAEEISGEFEDEPSPFDELWAALSRTRDVSTRIADLRRRASTLPVRRAR